MFAPEFEEAYQISCVCCMCVLDAKCSILFFILQGMIRQLQANGTLKFHYSGQSLNLRKIYLPCSEAHVS